MRGLARVLAGAFWPRCGEQTRAREWGNGEREHMLLVTWCGGAPRPRRILKAESVGFSGGFVLWEEDQKDPVGGLRG